MARQVLYGVGLILVAVAMVWIARPAQGQDSVPWLRIYVVGQLYLMTAMICGVMGVTYLISSWP
jgi:hypothetical protein